MHFKMLSHARFLAALLPILALAEEDYYTAPPTLPSIGSPIIGGPAPLFTLPSLVLPTNFPWMSNGGNGGGGYYTDPILPSVLNPLPSTIHITSTVTVQPIAASTAGGILNPAPTLPITCGLTTLLSTKINTVLITLLVTTTIVNTITTASVESQILTLTSSICPILPPIGASTADGFLTNLPSGPTAVGPTAIVPVPLPTYIPVVGTGLAPPLVASTALGLLNSLASGAPTILPYVSPIVGSIVSVPLPVASTALGLLTSLPNVLPTAVPPLVASTAAGILTSPPLSVPTVAVGGGGGATATLGYYGYHKREEVEEKREAEPGTFDDGGLGGGQEVKRCLGKRGARGRREIC